MDSYFDSAIIAKLYVQEANSADAIRLVSAYAAPYALTPWQALEVRKAIRLKAFRHEITTAEMTQSIAALGQDIAAGRWVRPAFTATTVERRVAWDRPESGRGSYHRPSLLDRAADSQAAGELGLDAPGQHGLLCRPCRTHLKARARRMPPKKCLLKRR